MNYLRYDPCDLTNGEGIRVTLYVTGCGHGCKGCHNPETWNPKHGYPVTDDLIQQILKDLAPRTGLSLTGGDPLYPRNRDAILTLCQRVKAQYPDKDIWLWTGYKYSQISHLAIMDYIDVLIDGRFEQGNKTQKPWRGSDNQRLHYLTDC